MDNFRKETLKLLLGYALEQEIDNYICASNMLRVALTERTDISEAEFIEALSEVVDETAREVYEEMNETPEVLLEDISGTLYEKIIMMWEYTTKQENPQKAIQECIEALNKMKLVDQLTAAFEGTGIELEAIETIETEYYGDEVVRNEDINAGTSTIHIQEAQAKKSAQQMEQTRKDTQDGGSS
jgi:actin-like ATPase involved in cell morphogenesis